jgi:hypothetical protein
MCPAQLLNPWYGAVRSIVVTHAYAGKLAAKEFAGMLDAAATLQHETNSIATGITQAPGVAAPLDTLYCPWCLIDMDDRRSSNVRFQLFIHWEPLLVDMVEDGGYLSARHV